MRTLPAILVAVAALSGCAGLDGAECGGSAGPEADLLTPWVDGGFLRTDPGQGWETVVLQSGGEDAHASVEPEGWAVGSTRLSPDGSDANFTALHVDAGAGHGRLGLDYDLSACGEARAGTLSWDLAPPAAGDSAEPGQGTHVYTAGFWENGTLFYTNIEAIDRGEWPRAEWYAWEGGEPLPVYVYGEDRSEQPAAWHDPQAGTPLEGTVPGLGYFTTIPGFNEALKGLSTTTVRVARLSPEEAYTRPGNEEHPLYGDALVFYIKVVDVVDLPCPMGVSRMCGIGVPQR